MESVPESETLPINATNTVPDVRFRNFGSGNFVREKPLSYLLNTLQQRRFFSDLVFVAVAVVRSICDRGRAEAGEAAPNSICTRGTVAETRRQSFVTSKLKKNNVWEEKKGQVCIFKVKNRTVWGEQKK